MTRRVRLVVDTLALLGAAAVFLAAVAWGWSS